MVQGAQIHPQHPWALWPQWESVRSVFAYPPVLSYSHSMERMNYQGQLSFCLAISLGHGKISNKEHNHWLCGKKVLVATSGVELDKKTKAWWRSLAQDWAMLRRSLIMGWLVPILLSGSSNLLTVTTFSSLSTIMILLPQLSWLKWET